MNTASIVAYNRLKNEFNATNLFYVNKEEIGIQSDDISDTVHPMDSGMNKQKDAVIKVIKEVLNMNIPSNYYNTMNSVSEHRNLEFEKTHQQIIQKVIDSNLTGVIVGDSITNNWMSVGKDSWDKFMSDKFINLGIGYDRIENVLYRIFHDEIAPEYIKLNKVVVLIRTNNIEINNKTEIVEGIKFLLKRIHVRQPDAKIFLLGILPRDGFDAVIKEINSELKNETKKESFWSFSDPGQVLLDEKTGLINNDLFIDGLHPNKDGYNLIAPLITAL